MENIPASLRFYVSQIENVQKVRVKLQSLNQTSIGSTGASQLRCALPVSSVLNMHSLAFHTQFNSTSPFPATGAAGIDANAIYALCPRLGAQSCIERVQWTAGGISLDSGSTPYNLIANMKTDICESSNKYMTDTKVLNNAVISPWLTNAEGSGIDDSVRGQRKDLILTNMLGWTAGAPSHRDASLFPEQFIEITAAGAHVLPVQLQGTNPGGFVNLGVGNLSNTAFTGAGCNYTLDNCYFSIETLSIGSGIYDGVTEALLEQRGSLDVPYTTYVAVSAPSSTPGTSVRGAVSTICLNKIYATMLNTATPVSAAGPPAAGTQQTYPYNLQQAPVACPGSTTYAITQVAHARFGSGVGQWQFRCNSSPSPLYMIDGGVETFMMSQAGEDRQYSKNEGGLVGSQEMFEKVCWNASTSYALTNNVRSLDGLNLQSINSQLEFNSTQKPGATAGDSGSRQVYLIAECTSLARVGMSRALAVVK
mgnify:CR=1 FL=1|tara:strand:- start:2434 stop:3870 length:1437 start_codon:yes stop_codon:yes gene_type:complete